MKSKKTCPRCSIRKPFSDFYRDKRSKDGLTSSCKPCHVAKSKAGTCSKLGCTKPKLKAKRGSGTIFLPFCRKHWSEKSKQNAVRREDSYIDKNGYMQILHPETRKRVHEHRVVMERILGRPLAKGESVHHKDGVRHNNSEDNLELWVGAIRYGQRAADLVCPHCHEPYLSSSSR